MKTLEIQAIKEFTPEMENLRREGYKNYAGFDKNAKVTDEFDAQSIHVIARFGKKLVGMVRLTAHSPSAYQTWAKEPLNLPIGEGVADITRGTISEEWRQMGIFKLLLPATVQVANDFGWHSIIAGVKPDAPHLPSFYELGYQDFGGPSAFSSSWIKNIQLKLLILDTKSAALPAAALSQKAVSKLKEKGIVVDSKVV